MTHPPERTEDTAIPLPVVPPSRAEIVLERFLFASRWFQAPLYVGLSLSLLFLIWIFVRELWDLMMEMGHATENDVILGVLGLIDLSLAANLVLIVLISGYENFVSKLSVGNDSDRFDWQGKVDFTTMKMKLIASMVAISGIHLLKVFMQLDEFTRERLLNLIFLHLTFVMSGVLLALMDLLSAKAKAGKDH